MEDLLVLITKLKNENTDAFNQLQKLIFDDVESNICLRLEKHFHLFVILENGEREFLVDDNFVTHPLKGEFYFFKEITYEVVSVIHYYFAKQPSILLLKPVTNHFTHNLQSK